MKTHTRTCLTIAALRRSIVYQPLAVLMAILMLPALSWLDFAGAGARLFQARAQVGGCAATGNTIIQNYCANGTGYSLDLTQFESDAVSAYLVLHNLPQSDAHVIYDYGRSDLRNAVRGVMMSMLLGIFTKPASARTPHEQILYNWMQNLVHGNEINMYQIALNSFHSWQNDPCHFGLDSAIASAYKLSYDGNPYCFATETDVVGAQVPAESYFTAYGLKESYGAAADTFPYFGGLVVGTGVNVAEVAGISSVAVDVLSAVAVTAGATVYAIFGAAVGAWVASGVAFSGIGEGVGIVAGAFSLSAGLIAGAILIPLLSLLIGIAAAVELFTNQQAIDTTNTDLKTGLTNATNTQPDLNAMATDTSGGGYYKLQLTLDSRTVPEVASTAPLPAHRPGTDLAFAIQSTVATTLTYKDWNGNTLSAQTWGGWFVQTCVNGSSSTCDQTDSIIASIHYLDASGVKWTASRMGNSFVSIKTSPNSTDKACPADSITLVTPNPDPQTCSSYVSSSIPLEDGNGNNVQVSFSLLTPPTFTSPSQLKFAPGIASTQTITALGNPTPTICLTSSTLPADFTLNGGSSCGSSFPVVFDGNLSAANGVYQLILTASGAGSPAIQTFSINVATQLAIVSPNTLNGVAGFPVSFLVVATGIPAPTLSMDPDFPLGGLTFKDNGNGTALISGTVGLPGGDIQCFKVMNGQSVPCGIIATNSQGTVEQAFTMNMASAPTAFIPGCSTALPTCSPGATFTAGVPNQVLLTTTDAITPVSWNDNTSYPPPPAWLNLKDNGNGTAVLSGTPPLGTTGAFTIVILAQALGSIGEGVNYPVTVVNRPLFTSPNTATFTVGTSNSFAISDNEGTISLGGTLPKGLSFVPGSPAAITGVPAVGTGGQYVVTLTASDTNGTAMQSLVLNVDEGPQITSANTANMFVGTPASFTVTTTGFPSVSNHVIPANPLPPTDPSQGNGMYFTVSGLPADLHASNLNPAGFAAGTLTIQGTPSAADLGPHQVQITAQNGVGTAAQQTLTLNIVAITGPAPVSGTACNGNYNGTFKGTITVSAGQNCAFYSGGVSGNVSVNGGNLALTNATVTGNMSIQGGSAFSIGPGTTIGGNLAIQNVASGSTTSQVCQANVAGNLEVSMNAIPISIGSFQNGCFGNSVGGNVDIQSNTMAIGVYDNTVAKNLSCSSNSSIAGSGNTARKKTGQCSGF